MSETEKSPPGPRRNASRLPPADMADNDDSIYVDEDGNPVDISKIDINSDEYELVEEDAVEPERVADLSAPPPPKPENLTRQSADEAVQNAPVSRSARPSPAPTKRGAFLLISVMFAAGMVISASVVSWLLTRESGPAAPVPGGQDATPAPVAPPVSRPRNFPDKPVTPRNTPPAGPAAVTVEAEAEDGTELVAPLRVDDDPGASGGRCLKLPAVSCDGRHVHPFDGPAAPERLAGAVQIPFAVTEKGRYALWIRKWWCCSEGDSFIVEMNGGRSYIFGDDGTDFRKWSWLPLTEAGQQVAFELKPGQHVLLIRSRGETGFRIDRILFTTDPDASPGDR